MSVNILEGDCLDVMPTLEADSIDAVICDPPYGLKFMGKEWDHGVPGVPFWEAAKRVAKPGAYLLAFGGTRTHHRLTVAIEDAGWEIRDCLMWLHGQGFPKSHDVSKSIDRLAPRLTMFAPFAQHYAAQRKKSGLTHSHICGVGGFFAEHNHGGASVNWEQGHNVPTLEQWKILQPLLNLSHEWLPLIERIEAERAVTGSRQGPYRPGFSGERFGPVASVEFDTTAAATDAAKQWQGWGTALKPSWEPIILARKPFTGTVAANVQEHGTGALNIDATRVSTSQDGARNSRGDNTACTCPERAVSRARRTADNPHLASSGAPRDERTTPPSSVSRCESESLQLPDSSDGYRTSDRSGDEPAREEATDARASAQPQVGAHRPHPHRVEAGRSPEILSMPCPKCTAQHVENLGRWPANLILDETSAALLDEMSGEKMHGAGVERVGSTAPRKSAVNMFGVQADTGTMHRFGDAGGASRFFYTAKASRSERDAGLEAMPKTVRSWYQTANGTSGKPNSLERDRNPNPHPRSNHHPTVKPLDLMQWLCRLVTPKGGLILDPFCGSGTTGRAAVAEGFSFIGIEKDVAYAEIARARIAEYAPLFGDVA